MGEIRNIVGCEDIVVIKARVQWWNQGALNLLALNTLINLIMKRAGFRGEVVIAENCHRGPSPWEYGGWSNNFEWNSDLSHVSNLNELSRMLKEKYGARFSKCHLIDVDEGNRRNYGPSDGVGYVYCDGSKGVPLIMCENGATGLNRRATIMTYPIFRTDKGAVIDFKNGIWKKGAFTGQTFRFINFSALNHHIHTVG